MTTVYKNLAIHVMRSLVISVMDHIEWRHHGIGVLQGYVQEGAEPEIRLHIWSRKLLKEGMELSGDIHDHRFDMISHVLCGSVEHEELIETANPDGDHAMMALTHARAAASTKYHGPTTALQGRYSVARRAWKIREGWSYTFDAQNFHRSPVHVDPGIVAVTCVEKHNQQEASARLLYPIDREPVMAFGHDIDKELIASLVSAAKAALQRSGQ